MNKIEGNCVHSNRPGLFQRVPNFILVILIVLVGYLLVWPVGDYLFIDDWAFTKSLSHLHMNGQHRIMSWNPMSLVSHLWWGLLFTKLFGFSFTVARISVTLLYLVQGLVLLGLFRHCGVSKGRSFVGAATVLLHPMQFFHAYTFMTDVPAVAWQMIALFAYVRGITSTRSRPQVTWLFCGTAAACVSFLIRQSGLLPAIALFLFIVLFRRDLFTRHILLPAFLPIVFVVSGFLYWYNAVHGPTPTFVSSATYIRDYAMSPPWEYVPYMLFTFSVYIGFFVLPLTFSEGAEPRLSSSRGKMFVFVLGLLGMNILLYQWLEHGRVFPYMRNTICRFGFMFENEIFLGERDVLWGKTSGLIAGIIFLVAALALASRWLTFRSVLAISSRGTALRLASVLMGLELCYVLLTSPILFDRHLLVLGPTATVIAVLLRETLTPNRWQRFLLTLCLVAMGGYSLAGTHDIHAQLKAIHEFGNQLVDEGVSPENICAGYSFECWHTFEERDSQLRVVNPAMYPWWIENRWYADQGPLSSQLAFRKDNWWIGDLDQPQDIRYAIATSQELPSELEFDVINSSSFSKWWPKREQRVFVLRLTSPPQDGSP